MTASLPVWPFAILAVLVMLGLRQSRTRLVEPGTLAKVALAMLALSLYGVTTAFGAHLVPVLAWATGFAVSLGLGAPGWRRAAWCVRALPCACPAAGCRWR